MIKKGKKLKEVSDVSSTRAEVITYKGISEMMLVMISDVMDVKLTEQRKEYERYIGALSEDFQSSLSAVAEVVVSTAKDMIAVKEDISCLKTDVSSLKDSMRSIHHYIKEHHKLHLRIESRFGALEAA